MAKPRPEDYVHKIVLFSRVLNVIAQRTTEGFVAPLMLTHCKRGAPTIVHGSTARAVYLAGAYGNEGGFKALARAKKLIAEGRLPVKEEPQP